MNKHAAEGYHEEKKGSVDSQLAGSVAERLLELRSRTWSLLKPARLGRLPSRLLFFRLKATRLEALPLRSGMGPCRLLLAKSAPMSPFWNKVAGSPAQARMLSQEAAKDVTAQACALMRCLSATKKFLCAASLKRGSHAS